MKKMTRGVGLKRKCMYKTDSGVDHINVDQVCDINN